MRSFLILIGLLIVQLSVAQDTLSVYFEFGKWRITREEQKTLVAIPHRFDLDALDSVQFIGMADSIGSFESNVKLSRRRAKEVADHCRSYLPPLVNVTVLAMGALDRGDRTRNRRVDVVFHFQHEPPQEQEEQQLAHDPGSLPEPPCYVNECDLTSRCIVTSFMKGRREFVEIEIPGRLTSPNPSEVMININTPRYRRVAGANEHIRLKWSRKPSRNKKAPAGFVTSMPKVDFDRHGVLIKKEGDCVYPTMDTCMRIDHALMQELQYKPGIFRTNGLHVRAPRHVVLPDARYYLGCEPGIPFQWEQRSGKRRSGYYYTRLPFWSGMAQGISREMISCADNCDTTYCNRVYFRGRCLAQPDAGYKVVIESGYHGQWNDDRPYVTMGLNRAGRWSLASVQAGIDGDLLPLASLRYQFHFLEFSPQQLDPTQPWLWPTDQAIIHRYFRAYVGTEMRWRGGKVEQRLLEQNLHLGIAHVNEKSSALLTRVFVQAGGAFDINPGTSDQPYFCWSVGAFIRLYRFGD